MTRKDLILKLIVEHFIKTAEPVSSKALLEIYNLDFSSATIRNEMVLLEEEGLIEKPHTSAGRVPSAAGYRYYVDNLRTHRLDQEIKYQLQQVFEQRHLNIEEVIKESCEILSQMTNLTIVMQGKDIEEDSLRDIQLIEINAKTAICIFVLESGEVATKKFQISDKMSFNEIRSCLKIFQDRLKGSSITNIIEKMESIKPLVIDYVESYELLLKTFLGALLDLSSEKMAVFGASNLLNQIEFTSDVNRLKRLMEMLENNSIWKSLDYSNEPLQVAIGANQEDLADLAVIKANISPLSGSVALVGPTRMDYDQVIEAFNYLQQQIEQLLMKGEKDEKRKNKKSRERG